MSGLGLDFGAADFKTDPDTGQGIEAHPMFPSLAVDRHSGNLYAVWALPATVSKASRNARSAGRPACSPACANVSISRKT